jgi:hypothetical protein
MVRILEPILTIAPRSPCICAPNVSGESVLQHPDTNSRG